MYLRMDVLWYLAYRYTPAKIAQMLSRFLPNSEKPNIRQLEVMVWPSISIPMK